MITMLRKAAIFSDFSERVRVLPIGSAEPDDLHWSHGACFSSWQEAGPDELITSMFQVFSMLVQQAGIPVETVHRAFCVIPEYRALLEPDHPDVLTEEEWRHFSSMMDLPARLRAA